MTPKSAAGPIVSGGTAEEVISLLELAPHPEGGFYKEIHRLPSGPGMRDAASSILFLLPQGGSSAWHRLDADELWLWHAGAPLELKHGAEKIVLGGNPSAGHVLQAVVPALAWQSAAPDGGWTLASCIVVPAFTFEGFDIADPGVGPDRCE